MWIVIHDCKVNDREIPVSQDLERALADAPAVLLLGPRQVGKTTLALQLTGQPTPTYLDLESEADRAKLQEPELFLGCA